MYEEQNSKEAEFLKKVFSEYYKANFVDSVPEIEKREFGYGVFKKKIANRNLAFTSAKALNDFLVNEKPLFVSYSNAYYKHPDWKPMQTKDLIGADLIYEFDADELKTSCKDRHDSWTCVKGHTGKGRVKSCPECGEGVENKEWFCSECIGEAKKQVFRLLDFFEKDLNFSPKDFSINFSGKAGYHVHLRSSAIKNLNKQARIEIVDYITANGIFFDNLGYNLDSLPLLLAKEKGAWVKRLNAGLKRFVKKEPQEIASITGLVKRKVSLIASQHEEILKAMDKGFLLPVDGRKSGEFWKKALEYVAQEEKAPIDRQTSIDLHKIVRVPMTLHGETGLIAAKVPLEKLESFDPFNDAIVLPDNKVKVFINKAPSFMLKGTSYGPYENEEALVPLYCAVYLIGKGAKLI
ncbi:MAG: DNA primase small subunit domain-containing protein [archaeon]